MPRLNVAVDNVTIAGVLVAPTTIIAADDAMFDAGSNVFVEAVAPAGGGTLTFITPATLGGLAVADPAVVFTANQRKVIGPFPANVFGQPSGADANKVYVDTADTGMTIHPFRVP